MKRPFFNTRSDQIIDIVLNVTNTEYAVFIAKCRKREIVRSRQIAQYLLKKDDVLSLSKIGELTGGKDHATIISSYKRIKGYLEIKDKTIIRLVNACEQQIKKIRNFHFKMWIPIYEHSKI